MFLFEVKTMTKAYSEDFRLAVLRQIKEGGDKEEVAKTFGIRINSINKWLRLFKENGNVTPKKRLNKPRKVDYEKLIEIIKNNPDIEQKEIGDMIGGSQSGVCRAMQRIGIVLKKRPHFTKKQMPQRK